VVVSTALPSLRVHLGANLSDLEWMINAYNLAFASLMLTGAALGDRFGRRRLYVIGLALFTASSLACAMAGNASELIAARAGEGVGAAVVLPVSLTLISEAFPLEKRHGNRDLGWYHRSRRRYCAAAGRRDPSGPRLAVDLLDQRADRPRFHHGDVLGREKHAPHDPQDVTRPGCGRLVERAAPLMMRYFFRSTTYR
jgi:hypothetical protein